MQKYTTDLHLSLCYSETYGFVHAIYFVKYSFVCYQKNHM